MSEFAMKKKLNAEIAEAKKAGKSVQTVGKLQYKLNQLMKTPQKGTPVKRKTPLTGSPSAGTAKKKAGPDMYKQAVALDKPKGKGTGIIKSTAKTTPYPTSNVKSVVRKRNEEPVLNKGGDPHVGMTQIGARTWVNESNLTSRQKDLAREYASVVKKRNKKY